LELNGILLAAYWTYLVEKDHAVFHEARIAVLDQLKGLVTARIPASALKSETTWKEYLKRTHVDKKEGISVLRRLGGKKAPSVALSPSTPSPPSQPKQRSKSILRNLGRAIKT